MPSKKPQKRARPSGRRIRPPSKAAARPRRPSWSSAAPARNSGMPPEPLPRQHQRSRRRTLRLQRLPRELPNGVSGRRPYLQAPGNTPPKWKRRRIALGRPWFGQIHARRSITSRAHALTETRRREPICVKKTLLPPASVPRRTRNAASTSFLGVRLLLSLPLRQRSRRLGGETPWRWLRSRLCSAGKHQEAA